MASDLLDRQLLFVTGKGGVGKTTIAAALGQLAVGPRQAHAAVRGRRQGQPGRCVRDRAHRASPSARSQPGLWAMSMDTEASLKEYLRLQLKLPLLARIGPLARTFDFVANAAPGVKEILTVGKLCYEVRERHYDLVVVDAPASGHIVGQLAAPAGDPASWCRWARCATRPAGCSTSCPTRRRPASVIVATPEEMPVNETIELSGRLRAETKVDLAAVVVNRVLPELFGRGEEEVFRALRDARGRPPRWRRRSAGRSSRCSTAPSWR